MPGETLEQALDRAESFLNDNGYVAHWEQSPEGYLLHTCNCPYEGSPSGNPELCEMDLELVSRLLGQTPERVGRLVEGFNSCAYLIREPALAAQ